MAFLVSVVVCSKTGIKPIKNLIEKLQLNISKIKVQPYGTDFKLTFTTNSDLGDLQRLIINDSIVTIDLVPEDDKNNSDLDEIIKRLPKRFSIYPPLLLLPPSTDDEYLSTLSFSQYEQILQNFTKCHSPSKSVLTHLAINKPIPIEKQQHNNNTSEDYNAMRSPSQLTILYGDFTNFWCHTIQNGIFQTWMPYYTMFSRGNIKEKARILNGKGSQNDDRLSPYANGIEKATVFDMYAGIGYFTLSYLSRGARRVVCWEINDKSVEGLVRGVSGNKFGECYVIKRGDPFIWERAIKNNVRCIIFEESNEYAMERMMELESQVGSEAVRKEFTTTHYNLGLLPSSKPVWPITCDLLNRYGGLETSSWIHVHDNVSLVDLEERKWEVSLERELGGLLPQFKCKTQWVERVKTYAPEVWHVVGDVEVKSNGGVNEDEPFL